MGKRSAFERMPRDNYSTPAAAVAPLLPWLPPGTRFIESCAGEGRLIDHLVGAGHILHGAYGWPDDDARTTRYSVSADDTFITNPPYWGRPRDLHPLICNLSDQALTWLLLPLDWAANLGSGELITKRCRLIVPIGRVKWIPGSEFTGKDNFPLRPIQPSPATPRRPDRCSP
jgi:hypothetical protein